MDLRFLPTGEAQKENCKPSRPRPNTLGLAGLAHLLPTANGSRRKETARPPTDPAHTQHVWARRTGPPASLSKRTQMVTVNPPTVNFPPGGRAKTQARICLKNQQWIKMPVYYP